MQISVQMFDNPIGNPMVITISISDLLVHYECNHLSNDYLTSYIGITINCELQSEM